MNYRGKLIKIWQLAGEPTLFIDWLIEESERNHKKSVQMAGDLGEAFGKISELESKLKDHGGAGGGFFCEGQHDEGGDKCDVECDRCKLINP